ncbi:MAG: MlaE family lipid ABC transporter permease subunit [Chlamydiales bacterium]|nr:ABC transporter permease [Chlamydiales bacterium]NCF70822.1 MlaE family lipid ABC transporter permease subunit [Chlamydiales bacterium]
MSILNKISSYFFDAIVAIGEFYLFIKAVLTLMFRRMPSFSLIIEHSYEIGVKSLPVVAITGFSTGLVLAVQSFYQLSDKGLAGATGLMVAKSMLIELGPILTAFMVTGRVGSAMCAELGSMKVTEQIDALRSMAVNPLRFLIVPRFIAGISMLPILTIFSCIMGIWGGYLISVFVFSMPPNSYLDPLPAHIARFDFFSGLLKSLIFGLIIITVCCFKGIKARGGAQGVGNATTQSVVTCYSIILIVNFVLSYALNILHQSGL